MNFKSLLKYSSVAAFLISQASASLTLNTQLLGDITEPSNSKDKSDQTPPKPTLDLVESSKQLKAFTKRKNGWLF